MVCWAITVVRSFRGLATVEVSVRKLYPILGNVLHVVILPHSKALVSSSNPSLFSSLDDSFGRFCPPPFQVETSFSCPLFQQLNKFPVSRTQVLVQDNRVGSRPEP